MFTITLSLRLPKANAQRVHMVALMKIVLTPAFVKIIAAGQNVAFIRRLKIVSYMSTVNGHGTPRKVSGLHNPRKV